MGRHCFVYTYYFDILSAWLRVLIQHFGGTWVGVCELGLIGEVTVEEAHSLFAYVGWLHCMDDIDAQLTRKTESSLA